MVVEQPYLYDPKYSSISLEQAFNPRAATQASWSAPDSKPKTDGPTSRSQAFNRHPDSYFVVPYGNLDYKPMGPKTRSIVKWTRLTQLFLRVCGLLGAVGMLFCGICLKGIGATTGWIIRITPGVAILHTIYATYHLARSSKGRTPSSSASYMLFAAVIDVGLIPFLVFTALIARTEYIEPVNVAGHWSTLFGSEEATTKITYATFLISVIGGSLHLASLILSLYLGLIFRKISRLPPDMNPLETNLTSRHKRKKSDLSTLDDSMDKGITGTTNRKDNPMAEDPLISPPRMLPFMHTRRDSHEDGAMVSHPSSSPRESRRGVPETPFYGQIPAHRSSQTTFQGSTYQHTPSQSVPLSKIRSQSRARAIAQNPLNTNLKPVQVKQAPFKQATESTLSRSPTKSSSIYSTSTITTIATSRPTSSHRLPAASSVVNGNWIGHPSPSPSSSPSPPRELKHLLRNSSYRPLPQTLPFEYTSNDENQLFKPLEMNPPTPPIKQQKRRYDVEQRALAAGTGNYGQGWRSGPGTIGIGKAQAWGGMGSRAGGGGRVVSRSGVEVRNDGILPNGGVRAREVSGKVVEEGRGGTVSWR